MRKTVSVEIDRSAEFTSDAVLARGRYRLGFGVLHVAAVRREVDRHRGTRDRVSASSSGDIFGSARQGAADADPTAPRSRTRGVAAATVLAAGGSGAGGGRSSSTVGAPTTRRRSIRPGLPGRPRAARKGPRASAARTAGRAPAGTTARRPPRAAARPARTAAPGSARTSALRPPAQPRRARVHSAAKPGEAVRPKNPAGRGLSETGKTLSRAQQRLMFARLGPAAKKYTSRGRYKRVDRRRRARTPA